MSFNFIKKYYSWIDEYILYCTRKLIELRLWFSCTPSAHETDQVRSQLCFWQSTIFALDFNIGTAADMRHDVPAGFWCWRAGDVNRSISVFLVKTFRFGVFTTCEPMFAPAWMTIFFKWCVRHVERQYL
jgi:hypothetical protein